MPKDRKQFYEYIKQAGSSTVTLTNYKESPACAFLKYVVDAKNVSCSRYKVFGKMDIADPCRHQLQIIK